MDKKRREPINFGYGRCSTLYQDYEYEKKELLKYGIKEENIYLNMVQVLIKIVLNLINY